MPRRYSKDKKKEPVCMEKEMHMAKKKKEQEQKQKQERELRKKMLMMMKMKMKMAKKLVGMCRRPLLARRSGERR
jgi:hypothetical protein